MRIYGVDFTSAPSLAKPIVCAECWFEEGKLRVDGINAGIADFGAFEAFLERPGPWVAGLDFPFGLPRRFVEALGWPSSWSEYVGAFRGTNEDVRRFEALVASYKRGKPLGQKHLFRETDRMAGAVSPMTLYGTPVGRMFIRGAPRLLRSGVNVLPCCPTRDSRTAVEAYPGLAARRLVGRAPYKCGRAKSNPSDRAGVRRRIAEALLGGLVERTYGLRVEMEEKLTDQCLADEAGDTLDAVLCAVQAAWAYSKREFGWGIPPWCDPVEGWIADPALLGAAAPL
ncbi:MAG: DUF429 domain-containing protein [Armatimonadota bacterium]